MVFLQNLEFHKIEVKILEKVHFRSQILERPSISEYWNISGVPVLLENVIFTFCRTCWWDPEANNTGMPKWSSIVQYSCTSIWDLKYTFSLSCNEPVMNVSTCSKQRSKKKKIPDLPTLILVKLVMPVQQLTTINCFLGYSLCVQVDTFPQFDVI